MDFEAFLSSKKIDSQLFSEKDRDQFDSWKKEYDLMHPKSFEARKLFLLNPIRRKYKLIEPDKPSDNKAANPVKPVFKPIIKR